MATALIPSEITTVVAARDALLAYAATIPHAGPPLFLGGDRPIRVPFKIAHDLVTNLKHTVAAGPVVKAQPDAGASYLIGRDTVPPGRSVLGLRVPDGPLASLDPVSTLAEVTAAAGIVGALAERCSVLADAYGHTRQARGYRVEATALGQFHDELAACIPDLADGFLVIWQAEAAARGDTPPPGPTTRPVNLR